jgi:hypothetical protein
MSFTPIHPLRTRVGHSEWQGNRYVGHSVPDLLDGNETLAGLLILAVCGRRLPPEERALVDDIAVAMTNGDPRIWPHKVALLLSAYGACVPAMAAGLLLLEGARIGPWTFGPSAELLLALREEAPDLSAATMLGAMKSRLGAAPSLPGFGVPFRPHCERLVLVRSSVARRGRDHLPFWRTMVAAVSAAQQLNGPEPNAGIGVAAALLDFGFTPRQISVLGVALAQPVFLATVVEGSEHRESALRRIPDDRVLYVGAPARESTRAERARLESSAKVGHRGETGT